MVTMFWPQLFNDRTGNVAIYKRRTRRGVTTWEPWFWLRRRIQ